MSAVRARWSCLRCGPLGEELTEGGCPTHGRHTVVEVAPNWVRAPTAKWRAITVKGPWDLPMIAPFARPGTAFWSVPVPQHPELLPEPKWCENRVWSTSWRGPLILHSGRGWDSTGEWDPKVVTMWRTLNTGGLRIRRQAWTWAGYVTAVAQLVGCHPATPTCCRSGGGQYHDDERNNHLVLADVWVLTEPADAVGRQRLWRPDSELVERVRANIPATRP